MKVFNFSFFLFFSYGELKKGGNEKKTKKNKNTKKPIFFHVNPLFLSHSSSCNLIHLVNASIVFFTAYWEALLFHVVYKKSSSWSRSGHLMIIGKHHVTTMDRNLLSTAFDF